MIRRLLLTSGIMLAGTVAFSPKALAQSVDVLFSANVGPECSFATPIPGTLVLDSDYNSPYEGSLTSIAPGGVSGQVDVSCNTSAQLQITDARFVSFTPTNPDPFAPPFPPQATGFIDARARSQYGETFGIQGPPIYLDNGNQTVEVDMWAEPPYEAGIYEYAVTLTITP
ncbi:MAG: hypothetical protein F6K47_31260 [Symploca sp. SIO2E6]|nr:hypothetical protein [Symploca sp. SIO2E6]